ncbi:MAG: N-acetyl sugar amidotransferase [Chitinophagaceae bacterium]|nr:N-acetyl sugar amidotransferase [Chitinophagaceae bacterium]
MDTTDPDIVFDNKMVCNHYYNYQNNVKSRIEVGNQAESELVKIIEKIKREGKSKPYDCIIGVSGGTDSTFVAYKCKELGLRPLAVHFDNGWNSELAVSNIEKVLNQLEIDLYTYVIDWKEFSDLQVSFLKSSTPDIEIPTDHAIFAILYKVAVKYKIKYIMNGMNFRTESIMPSSWAYGHIDWKYIKNVHKTFSNGKLKSYPRFSFLDLFYYTFFRRIKFISILNYLDFNKEEAQKFLTDKLGWRDYGGKHHESVYTRIVQTYILPKKFNIDKRKAHLSNLILSGQITREQALKLLEIPPFEEQQSKEDVEYLIKKLKLSSGDFENIMNSPNKTFKDYPNNYTIYLIAKRLQQFLRKIKLFHK